MVATDFILAVNDALRGTDDDAPTAGSDEWQYWMRTYNRVKSGLYEDITKRWSNTYSVASLGTVAAAAAPSYNLGVTYLAPANLAYVVTSEGHKVEYEIIEPQERDITSSARKLFIAGANPQVAYFTTEITATENIVDGTLYLPGFFMPADLALDDGDAVINLPDPYWGVMAVAAEIAFSDITYEDKAADLNAKATALYMQMVAKNRGGSYGNPRKVPTGVRRIGMR